MRCMKSLVELDASARQDGSLVLAAITSAVRGGGLRALRKLDLGRSCLGRCAADPRRASRPIGLYDFATAVQLNEGLPELRELIVESNLLDDACGGMLFRAVWSMARLQVLDARNNSFGDGTASGLSRILLGISSLERVDVRFQQFSDAALTTLRNHVESAIKRPNLPLPLKTFLAGGPYLRNIYDDYSAREEPDEPHEHFSLFDECDFVVQVKNWHWEPV